MKSTENKPSWWNCTKGSMVQWQHAKLFNGKKVQCRVVSVGNNKGPDTLVTILLPTIAKGRKVRIKELTW
jgi:hypothetical protein